MKRYKAVTLLELLIVIAIMFILSLISVIAYRSLVDSFSINEVSLTIAQDIRATQRAAMLLDREGDERWLHGIGIDFRDINTDRGDRDLGREYTIFKWCSKFDYYDQTESELTGEAPNLALGENPVGEGSLSLNVVNSCLRYGEDERVNAYYPVETKSFTSYDNLEFELLDIVAFVLFESVSGKAFFYDEHGSLLNYGVNSEGELFLFNTNELHFFELRLEPMRGLGLPGRNIVITPVSGIANLEVDEQ